jgi:hypothetical protein
MFANYLVNLVGQFTGRKLSLLTPGAYANDLLNLPDNWMKNIVGERHFLLTLCCCRQKVSRTARMLFEKSHADAARDGSKR